MDGKLEVSGCDNSSVSVYDVSGRKNYQSPVVSDKIAIPNLQSGIYIIRLNNHGKTAKIVSGF
jgi:hypothetical protein